MHEVIVTPFGFATTADDVVAGLELTGKQVIVTGSASGIMGLPELQRTPEGFEMQFATNFLGHFALTIGLRDSLVAAKRARVACRPTDFGGGVAPYALDAGNAARLWDVALNLCSEGKDVC